MEKCKGGVGKTGVVDAYMGVGSGEMYVHGVDMSVGVTGVGTGVGGMTDLGMQGLGDG